LADHYTLPEELAYLLASEGTDHFMGGLFLAVPVLLRTAPQVADAFRAGGGVPFETYGLDLVEAIDLMSAGIYEQRFASHWLGKMPEVVKRLEGGGRVLDVGYGSGRVGRTIARAFPKCEVVGLDPDPASIERARTAAGSTERVRFVAGSTSTFDGGEGFDLITACDCIHDLAAPARVVGEMKRLLKPGGTLFIVEPRAGDTLAENSNPIGTMYYGFSLFHCMSQSLASDGLGLGACMGPARMRALLSEAGFTDFQQVDIRSPTNMFYAAKV
jgi:ubiquinone/menaquinone biosynthesis C-methylase UbiE